MTAITPSEDALEADDGKVTDHRVRVAKMRRERMRARLQAAILHCCAVNHDHRPPSVEQVCKEADVSRVSFYKYFDSVHTAMESIGDSLLQEMADSLKILLRDEPPLAHIVMGQALFLMRAATDPIWGAFVSKVTRLNANAEFIRKIGGDLRAARDMGVIDVADLDAAMSMALASVFSGIGEIYNHGERHAEFCQNIIIMVLRGLGVDKERATSLVAEVMARIRVLAPGTLDWWPSAGDDARAESVQAIAR